ncbi:unnamed protein product [Phaeothamnion confervicola]
MSGAAPKRIFFGSIDALSLKRESAEGTGAPAAALDEELEEVALGEAAIAQAKAAGNINIHDTAHTQVLALSAESRAEQEKHAELLRRLEAERRARQLIVPTKAEDVRAALRKLGQPVRLFGEKVGDVRERLKAYLARLEVDGEEAHKVDFLATAKPPAAAAAPAAAEGAAARATGEEGATIKTEAVYTTASEALVAARREIAAFSFPRTEKRLAGVKRRRDSLPYRQAGDTAAAELYAAMRGLVVDLSAIGDERPLSALRVAPDGTAAATGSWTSFVHVWDASSLERRCLLIGHTERVTGVAWHPNAYGAASVPPGAAAAGGGLDAMDDDGGVNSGSGINGGGGPILLASAAADRTARLWDCRTKKCVHVLRGHADRLARVDFHPSGCFVGTASFDHTWRLWDCETGQELLLQDGHRKEVYAISFQKEGGLVMTGDLGGAAMAWDLRSGKSVARFEGHIKRITCGDFSPNGHEIATGSDDNTARIWDLRRRGCVYCLPAHTALISDVRYGPQTGEVLATCGFDGAVKVWSTRDFGLLKALAGHEGKVTACDFSPDERRVLTCGFDRTVKVWAAEGPM